jgi:hypothetical protein
MLIEPIDEAERFADLCEEVREMPQHPTVLRATPLKPCQPR